ncbi:hypothetical protein J2S30_001923 [Herbaspirillum rubrisubalbicans]|nr:hypothetical protein [Herbaspirillum rubrisubalbicans]MCP1573544.1 hypothetical protein [Herbaspirillum rubrisubalbicans]
MAPVATRLLRTHSLMLAAWLSVSCWVWVEMAASVSLRTVVMLAALSTIMAMATISTQRTIKRARSDDNMVDSPLKMRILQKRQCKFFPRTQYISASRHHDVIFVKGNRLPESTESSKESRRGCKRQIPAGAGMGLATGLGGERCRAAACGSDATEPVSSSFFFRRIGLVVQGTTGTAGTA